MPLLSEHSRARAALVTVTIIWGSSFVVIHSGLDRLSPFVLVSLRFLLAGAALALLRPGALRGAKLLFWLSLPLSLSKFAGFTLQTIGLQSTTPARSAFITCLTVVMVPAFDFLYTRRRPAGRLLGAVLLAAGGVYVLFRPIGLEWRGGDTWTLLSAVAFAFYVVELARMSRRFDVTSLVLVQCLTVGGAAALIGPFVESSRIEIGWPALGVLAYLGLVCTALVVLLMTWGQARIGAIEAAVIYTLEPVFAAAFSILLGRDALTLNVVLGGGLIVTAMLLSGAKKSPGGP